MLLTDSDAVVDAIYIYIIIFVYSYNSLKVACDCYNQALDNVLCQVSLLLPVKMQHNVFSTTEV